MSLPEHETTPAVEVHEVHEAVREAIREKLPGAHSSHCPVEVVYSPATHERKAMNVVLCK